MSEENSKNITEETAAVPTEAAAAAPAENPAPAELVPSMDDFKDEITRSFRKLKQGDIVKGTVIGISETEVTLDLGCYAEGIIKLEELSNDPRFSIKADVTVGEEITATVLREDKEGNILLSRKQADDVLAWETLKQLLTDRTPVTVKVAQEVKGGVVTYLHGIRAFIPASKLTAGYVEDLSSFVGQEIQVQVITADEENKKLVLSGKDLAMEKERAEKNSRAASLPVGTVTTGKVEKIMPFGAFVAIGDGLSGLVHISQMSTKRIKTPNEVVKVGDEVTVRVRDVKDGKISLTMRISDEKEERSKDVDAGPREYSSGGEAVTGLGALLKNIKLN